MAKRLSRFLQRDSFGRHVAVLAGGTALGQALAFLALPFITRLYTPSDMGILSVYASLLSLFLAIACFGYEKAVPIAESDSDGANAVGICAMATLIVALTAGLVLVGFSGPVSRALGVPGLAPYMGLVPVGILGAGLYQALNAWATRKKTYGSVALTKISQSVGMVATQIGLGVARVGVFGLLLGDALGRALGAGTFLRQVWKQDRAVFAQVSRVQMWAVATRFRDFPRHGMGAALLHTAATALAPLLFSAWFGREVAGQYATGQRALWAPMALIGTAIAQVFLAQAAEYRRTNPARIKPLFEVTLKRLLLAGLAPIVVLTLAGGPLFALIFGEPYREAGVYLQIIGVTQLVQFAVGPVFPVLSVLEKPRSILIWDAVGFVAIVGGLGAAHLLGASGRVAMAVYGAGTIVLYGGLLAAAWKAVREAEA